MLEYALRGDRRYWSWLVVLTLVIGTGFYFYLLQLDRGLGITGMSRDVSWGLYIAQFTFIVGIAASAVTVVLPYYLHSFREFGKITILGEFLAIPSVIMCMLFVFVDLGQPARVVNIFLYPSLHSLMFWDVMALGGYLILNVVITRVTLDAGQKSVAPPAWIRPVIVISIPWAISIHTVTALLFAGLSGRPFWLTAILAPRFLASAFSAGPALLVLFCFVLKKVTGFNPGDEALRKLGLIITYAMCANVFFILMELFTTLYGGIPDHVSHLQLLYLGLDGNTRMVPWMWTSAALGVLSLVSLLVPRWRGNSTIFSVTCAMVFFSIWIDKGLCLMTGGFLPTPFSEVPEYWPSIPESLIALGVWAVGFFLVTIFYKIALSVRKEIRV